MGYYTLVDHAKCDKMGVEGVGMKLCSKDLLIVTTVFFSYIDRQIAYKRSAITMDVQGINL